MKKPKIVFLILCAALLVAFSGCALKVSQPAETTAAPSISSPAPSTDAPTATALSGTVFIDKYLGDTKTLQITGDFIYLYEKLGVEKTTVINRKNCSVETSAVPGADLCEVKISDNTGQTIDINLSQADADRVREMLGG